MKFISLIDIRSNNIITIDADSLILKLETDGAIREVRLKAYHAEILYILFSMHPKPLTYEAITEHLRQHNLIVSDLTRMHRKLSEIRNYLIRFHPSLGNLILNTRGIGYSLSLYLRHMYATEHEKNIEFKNPKITKSLNMINNLIHDAITLTAENKIFRSSQGFVINCNPCCEILAKKIAIFNKASDIILKEIRTHEADFTSIRIQYQLAKLRTYVGLARVSDTKSHK